ncbi:MAG: hypothetical protein GXP28_02290 [Planctomycetes bacterium]|nr:hypothetical protein [Planctomycetota bacterium]
MTSNPPGLTPTECVRLLTVYRRRWMIPTLVCAVLATTYAVFMPRYWGASQALVVRGEASSSSSHQPGKFADLYEMRTFQETILELVKSRQVLSETLKSVEQAETGKIADEPSRREIETFRKRVDMRPPGGAEFGKTEIFYLNVKDRNSERAGQLVDGLRRQLDLRLRKLRNERSQSLIDELESQVAIVGKAHDAETSRLVEFETEIGSDLGELRMLHSANSGQSDLRQQVVSLKNESRLAEARTLESEQLLVVLHAAQQAPEQLIAMPSSLLTSQPTLRRLKDGLVDAQLRAARLSGTRTAEHPQVLASIESVNQIRDDLHRELQVAVQGVEIELGLNQDRYATILLQFQDIQRRLDRLAQRRVEYSNRVSAAETSQEVLDQAQKQLSEVRAGQVAAQSVSLVTPIDRPEVGSDPLGLRRASVLAIGSFGGLVLGLGWVFLTVAPVPTGSPESAVGEAKFVRPTRPTAYRSATLVEESLELAVPARSGYVD